jgi:hypothetical protein
MQPGTALEKRLAFNFLLSLALRALCRLLKQDSIKATVVSELVETGADVIFPEA